MNLIEYFPAEFTPRPAQTEILNQIQDAFEQNFKFVIVQAPTGCGKSHIVASLVNSSKAPDSRFIEIVQNNELFSRKKDGEYVHEDEVKDLRSGSYVLTTTKYLQNQYDAVFNNTVILKGKQNYKCNIDDTFSVNVAPCVLTPSLAESCIGKNFCTYYNKLNETLCSKFRTTNYSKYLTLPSVARYSDVLICDEASELEEAIVKYYSINLEYKKLLNLEVKNYKPLGTDDPAVTKQWLIAIKKLATSSYENISDSIKNTIHSNNYTQGEAGRLSSLRNIIDRIEIVLENWHFCKFTVTRSKDGISITPIHIDVLARQMFNKSNKVVLLSSTIYDVNNFAKALGIGDFKYIEHPGVFDSKKSPVYAPCKVNLNQSNLQISMPIIIKQIQEICELYPNSKGVIHTHTNTITSALQKKLSKNPRFLFRINHLTNEHILYDHKNNSEATVLVSPSLTFGVDLPDDLCRFQIIVKLPYPGLGDKRVSILAKESSDWYQAKMFTKLIQMSGRGTRNEHDYCDTFILDGNFVRVVTDNWNKLPVFFKDRLM